MRHMIRYFILIAAVATVLGLFNTRPALACSLAPVSLDWFVDNSDYLVKARVLLVRA